MKHYLTLILVFLFFSGCQTKPTETEDPERVQASQTVKEFLSKHYKDWKVEGDTLDISDVGINTEVQFFSAFEKRSKFKSCAGRSA